MSTYTIVLPADVFDRAWTTDGMLPVGLESDLVKGARHGDYIRFKSADDDGRAIYRRIELRLVPGFPPVNE